MGCKPRDVNSYMPKLQAVAVGIRAWMHNHIPLFYMDVITNPCLNRDAGLADLYY